MSAKWPSSGKWNKKGIEMTAQISERRSVLVIFLEGFLWL